MPAFLAAVLANIAANFAAAPASARLRAAWERRGAIGEPRTAIRPAPQLPEPRAELTPTVSYGPPVPATRPGSARLIADKLAARRS